MISKIFNSSQYSSNLSDFSTLPPKDYETLLANKDRLAELKDYMIYQLEIP